MDSRTWISNEWLTDFAEVSRTVNEIGPDISFLHDSSLRLSRHLFRFRGATDEGLGMSLYVSFMFLSDFTPRGAETTGG